MAMPWQSLPAFFDLSTATVSVATGALLLDVTVLELSAAGALTEPLAVAPPLPVVGGGGRAVAAGVGGRGVGLVGRRRGLVGGGRGDARRFLALVRVAQASAEPLASATMVVNTNAGAILRMEVSWNCWRGVLEKLSASAVPRASPSIRTQCPPARMPYARKRKQKCRHAMCRHSCEARASASAGCRARGRSGWAHRRDRSHASRRRGK
jgi:hypothetical protein